MAIPKIIHYAWFSDEPVDALYAECFAGWAERLPGYIFQLWDGKQAVASSFFDKMIRQEKWAFAADYVRLYALYHHGGIYLDLDVRVLKSFNTLLHYRCLLGREDAGSLGCHFMAAEKGHPFIKRCLDFYDRSLRLRISPPPTMPRIINKLARRQGLLTQDIEQTIAENITVLPSEYFSPFHYHQLAGGNPDQYITKKTYCIHYWHHGWSWLDQDFRSHIINQPWLFMNFNDWKRFFIWMKKKFL